MKTKKYIILTLATLLSPGLLKAQSLEESVTVEGRYTPEEIAADRLPVAPAIITFSAPESNLTYERRGVAANFAPDALRMPPTGWRSTKSYDNSRGYVDLTLGSWLNSSLSAGYAAIRNANTQLGVRFQHNSTSLWQAWKADPAEGKYHDASKRFRYDEALGVDLRQRIANAGTLTAEVQYHYGHFNYYASTHTPIDSKGRREAPIQDLNDVYGHVRWGSHPTERLHYSADADVRYFGFRKSFSSVPWNNGMFVLDSYHETVINAGGNVGYSLSKVHNLDFGLQYSGIINSTKKNFNRVRFMPGYEYTRGNTYLRIGAELSVNARQNIELIYDFDGFNYDPDKIYRVKSTNTRFRIAPDIRFAARSKDLAFSASIGGGTYLRTLAWWHEMDYYSNPDYLCYGETYSPIDARIALQYNPGGRLTLGVDGAWATLLDQPFGGIYQCKLNDNKPKHNVYEQNRIHGFTIGVNAGYEFSKYFGVKGRFNWQPQNGNAGYLNGFDRPEITAELSATSRPIDALMLKLDYNLRAKRYLVDGNISRLNLTADYRINEKLTIGAALENLLNRHEYIQPELPTEGFTAAGRIQMLF